MSQSDRHAGFTLIELMIVITIISLLAIALLPQVTEMWSMGSAAATEARIQHLKLMIEKFADQTGEYPPSDFAKAMKGVKVKADSMNSGIECLMIHLHSKNLPASLSLDDKQDWLTNTDDDDNGSEIPGLRTTKKLELSDAWGTPFAYFTPDMYAKAQSILTGGEEGTESEVEAKAMKDDKGYLNPRKYQILSAGEDLQFGTEDDICYPPRPEQ